MSSDTPQPLPRRAALLGLLAMAGCGFVPAYGPGGGAVALRNATALVTPDTVTGFHLRSRLQDRLGAGAGPYALTVTMAEDRSAAAINSDGDTTRFNLVGTAEYTLTGPAGRVLARDRVRTFASYAASGSTVATQTAAGDASVRLAMALADLILADLLLLDLGA